MNNSINTGTIVRTVVLVFALANQFLTMAGYSVLPFSEAEVEGFVSALITAGAAVWAWWKNNSFTQAARAADGYLKELRQGESGKAE